MIDATAKCLICGWLMAEHSESQVRTCQMRHEELRKRRGERVLRTAMRRLSGGAPCVEDTTGLRSTEDHGQGRAEQKP